MAELVEDAALGSGDDAVQTNRQAIEESEGLQVSFPAFLEPWAETITESMRATCGVAAAKGLRLDTLRLIEITADMSAAVLRWQRELREPESGVTDTSHGVVAGKTITWIARSGKSVPCTVVIFNAQLLPALLNGSPHAVSVLIHELAHVHEEAMAYHAGLREPPSRTGDIPALKRCIASMIWQEYFAERFTASIVEDSINVADWALLVQEKHERIKALRAEWYATRDLQVFWNTTVTQIADAGQAIGRALGRLANRPPVLEQFIEALSFAPRWQALARAMLRPLDEMYAGALDASPDPGSKLGPMMPDLWEEHGVRVKDLGDAGCQIAIANSDVACG